MSRRTEKLASSIRSAIAEIVRHQLNDPRITPLVSVTRVEVAPDLSSAHVHFSTFGSEGERRACMAGLVHARARVRGLLGKQVRARQIPELIFHEDESLKRAAETLKLIGEAMAELTDVPAEPAGAPTDGSAASEDESTRATSDAGPADG